MLLRCRDLWCCYYVICCYAAEISGVVATVCMRRGWVGWGGHVNIPGASYLICSYAAGISGVVAMVCVNVPATSYVICVAMLQRSLVLLLRCVHEGVGWGGVGGHVNVPATSYVICCYAAEISGVVATVSKSDLIVSKSIIVSEAATPSFQI